MDIVAHDLYKNPEHVFVWNAVDSEELPKPASRRFLPLSEIFTALGFAKDDDVWIAVSDPQDRTRAKDNKWRDMTLLFRSEAPYVLDCVLGAPGCIFSNELPEDGFVFFLRLPLVCSCSQRILGL